MKLTTKQIAYLRSLGQTLEPAVRIGKNGLTDEVIDSVRAALTANELIKVRILNRTSPVEPKEALEDLADKIGAVFVQVIGHNGLLYLKNKKKPQIRLPL